MPSTIHRELQADPVEVTENAFLLESLVRTATRLCSLYFYEVGKRMLFASSNKAAVTALIRRVHRTINPALFEDMQEMSHLLELLIDLWTDGTADLRLALEALCATVKGLSYPELRALVGHETELAAMLVVF